MAGPAKKRAQAEKNSSSEQHSSSGSGGRDVTVRSTPKSIPRLDGNRDPRIKDGNAPVEYSRPQDLKNLSEFLGLAGWYTARGFEMPDNFVHRPAATSKIGREVDMALNTYNIGALPVNIVHQYDIGWTKDTDATKRVLLKKIWNSKAVKGAIGEPKNHWIYDGNKLAWSGAKMPRDETRIVVDLDEEDGRPTREGKEPNKHTIIIRWTRKVDFSGLKAFVEGNASWSPECIDTINFLDHVLRERPGQLYTQIKKSFFPRGEQRFDLGGGVEAFKGVFASLRPVLNDQGKKGMAINVDVANGTFWRAQGLGPAISQVFNCNPPQFITRMNAAKSDWRRSTMKKDLARFKRVGVTATHNPKALTQWTIDEIMPKDAYEATFNDPDDKTPGTKKRQITVAAYFKTKYNITLTKGLPVVKMTKKIRKGDVYLPMQYLTIDQNQRYNTKLSDVQTSNMIKFAVTLPAKRRQDIADGVNLLQWGNDPYLAHYGIKVAPTMSTVKARVLPSPQVGFAPLGKPTLIPERDLVQGRWRLDGKKFILPNTVPIACWGVCAVDGRGTPSPQVVQAFVENFVKIYKGHGGVFGPGAERPHLYKGNPGDAGEMISQAYTATGNKFNKRPTIMFFIVNDRNVDMYRRIKKSADCRFGVPSQVLQSKHVQANQAQYISNVCMKVNAKLGGATTFTRSSVIPRASQGGDKLSTMVIGADVSHPAPGAGSDEKASFAAMTMSSDANFTRYWAQCNTNGCRVEMVTTANIVDHIGDMAKKWMSRVGQGHPPKRVLYIRDGVSEGQYAQVLENEVRDIKETFKKCGAREAPPITVVIAGKRHHVRFFPKAGDRNGNPLPGTLVETGCTHPFEFDFYLCSHVAIKGTARPIHYQCILNEDNQFKPTELQSFLFEHSYQYVRSTTPVSLHPAVYYAHLAADRSRAHANESPISSGKKEQKPTTVSGSGNEVEVRPLMKLGAQAALVDAMWYV